MRKVEPLPNRDCEAGYGPARLEKTCGPCARQMARLIRLCRCRKMITTQIMIGTLLTNPPVEEGNEMLDSGHNQYIVQSHSGQGSQTIPPSHHSRNLKSTRSLRLGQLNLEKIYQKLVKISFYEIMYEIRTHIPVLFTSVKLCWRLTSILTYYCSSYQKDTLTKLFILLMFLFTRKKRLKKSLYAAKTHRLKFYNVTVILRHRPFNKEVTLLI